MASKLTDLAIRKAAPRANKYKLSGGNGLTLIVMPDGAKYWRLRYRLAGKEKEISIGPPYPELSLKDAEAGATRLRALLADGLDPAEQRFQAKLERKQNAAQLFGEAAEAWFEFRRKAWALRTAEQVREYLDKDLLPALVAAQWATRPGTTAPSAMYLARRRVYLSADDRLHANGNRLHLPADCLWKRGASGGG